MEIFDEDSRNYYHICPICGKRFYSGMYWGYKRSYEGRKYFFCRYNHIREWDKKVERYRALEKAIHERNVDQRAIKKRLAATVNPVARASLEDEIKVIDELNARDREERKNVNPLSTHDARRAGQC